MGPTAGRGAPSRIETCKCQLSRVLGFRDLVVLVVGTVIGSGIFLVPGVVLRQVGNSVPLAITVWLAGGLLSLLGALTYGELSAMKPQAGGLYVYIRDCFGPFVAFLFGWTLFFVISSGSVATLAVAFSNYFGEFIALDPWMARVVSAVVIAVIALVNVFGTRESADLQDVTTGIKVGAIVLMAAALLLWGKESFATPAAAHGLSGGGYVAGFGMAMISVLWAYEGWQYATFSAGEAIHPQRNFPLAFFSGSAALIAIYLLANFGYLAALGPGGVSTSDRVASTAVSR
ncbi:MAG TPA: amino acid permease, partial [Terriglobales bacterium]